MSNIELFKNPIPLKAIPEGILNSKELKEEFTVMISDLLSIKPDNLDKIYLGWEAVKKLCWSMGLPEIKKMFEMYALNQLGIPPKSNHFDVILVGTIFSTYRAIKLSKPKPKQSTELVISDEEKERNAYLNCIFSFDNFKVRGVMDRSDWAVYDELESRKVLDFTKDEKSAVYQIMREKHPDDSKDSWVERSKTVLLERFYLGLTAKNKHLKSML